MDVMLGRAVLAACVSLSFFVGIPPAGAGVFITSSNDAPVRSIRHQAVITHHDQTTSVIQSITLRNRHRRFIWLKPFPVEPEIGVKPQVTLNDIAEETTVRAPYNHAIRNDLFGPSSVSWLIDALGPRQRGPTGEALQEAPRRLEILDYEVFKGEIQTSTITGLRVMPPPMRRWFNRRGFPISEESKASMAGHLNRGWVLVAVEIGDASPNPSRAAQTPPILFRFTSKEALFPLLRQPRNPTLEPTFDFWVVGSKKLVSARYPNTWAKRPWDAELQPGHFIGVYSRAVAARDPLTDILTRQLDLQLPPSPQLVRHRFQHGAQAWQEIAFVPALRAPTLPGVGQRGSGLDLFLCLFLGLTPLLFAPESWFLLWLNGQKGPKGRRWPDLWPFYALVVGMYWLATLDGLGRVAAVVPLLIGVVQLLWPGEPEPEDFVRVHFKRTAKAPS